MGYKDDNYSTKVCGHHPETCTCRDWDTKEERERGFTITNVDKQETFEDVAERYVNKYYSEEGYKRDIEESIKFGAQLQQERMYSKEEVLTIIREFDKEFYQGIAERNGRINGWFERNKKK